MQLFYDPNQFVTKTCLTTFTYSTTYIDKDGSTKIESREKVITNTATEERNAFRIQPTATSGITLTQVHANQLYKAVEIRLCRLLDAMDVIILFALVFRNRLHSLAPAYSKPPTRI